MLIPAQLHYYLKHQKSGGNVFVHQGSMRHAWQFVKALLQEQSHTQVILASYFDEYDQVDLHAWQCRVDESMQCVIVSCPVTVPRMCKEWIHVMEATGVTVHFMTHEDTYTVVDEDARVIHWPDDITLLREMPRRYILPPQE